MSDTEARVRGAFRSQGKSCAILGSPFMARLMPLIGERLTGATAPGARILNWEGDVGPAGQSVPLRLAGALHAQVLGGNAPRLAAVYPPARASDEDLWGAIAETLASRSSDIMQALDRPPQTNEIRRAAALLPALWWLAARTGHDTLDLMELGASAGLNLSLDRFAIDTPQGRAGPSDSPVILSPDWRNVPPAPRDFAVRERSGVDISPLDPRLPGDALRLMSYIWPDQPERMALTRGAITLCDTPVDAGDAAAWLDQRFSRPLRDGLTVVYTTIAWQYFPTESKNACTATLERTGNTATPRARLAQISLEADGRRDGAALAVRLWPDAPEARVLARADFHGRWIDWQARD